MYNNCLCNLFCIREKQVFAKKLPHETTKGGSLRQLDIEVEGGREGGSTISSGTGLCVDLGGEYLCNARVV